MAEDSRARDPAPPGSYLIGTPKWTKRARKIQFAMLCAGPGISLRRSPHENSVGDGGYFGGACVRLRTRRQGLRRIEDRDCGEAGREGREKLHPGHCGERRGRARKVGRYLRRRLK